MTRCFLALGLMSFGVAGCNPPGKPTPTGDDGRPGSVLKFETLYKTHCAGCHGADGTLGPAPPLNDPLFLKIVPNEALLQAIGGGRPGTPMPAFDLAKGGALTSAQVKVLADGLKTKWGKPTGPNDVPPYLAGAAGDTKRGAAVFARACAGCHGDHGQGGTFEGRPVGAVNDPAYLALSSDQVLRRFVITGRPDLKMPNFAEHAGRPGDFQPLDAQNVADVTALLASWRKPAGK